MEIKYTKYHALLNDFLIIETKSKMNRPSLEKLAFEICNRSSGVGADGIIVLSESKTADCKFDIYNSDGSWAEKSGNGLRIAGRHLFSQSGKKQYQLETATGINAVKIVNRNKKEMMLAVELGQPVFETGKIPVKTSQPFMINAPLKIGGENFPVTCVSIGNPHTVLFVDNFDFDWQTLGYEIEHHKMFPNRTNVEFVKATSRKKIKVADWERGAGPTGSSGTGAAAAVAVGVTLGILNRECEVVFENGSLYIKWNDDNNIIELTGPVVRVSSGVY